MVGCGGARVEVHGLIVARTFYVGKCRRADCGPVLNCQASDVRVKVALDSISLGVFGALVVAQQRKAKDIPGEAAHLIGHPMYEGFLRSSPPDAFQAWGRFYSESLPQSMVSSAIPFQPSSNR